MLASSSVDTLAIGDFNCALKVYKLDLTTFQNIQLQPVLFQFKLKSHIRELFFDHSGNFLLTSTEDLDKLYSVSKKKCAGSIDFGSTNRRRIWKWFNVPKPKKSGEENSQFGLVIDGQLRFYSVTSFPNHDSKAFSLDYKVDEGFVEQRISSITLHEPSGMLILDVRQKNQLCCQIYHVFIPKGHPRGNTQFH